MENLGKTYKLGRLELKNRIIRASLLECLLDNDALDEEGGITEKFIENHSEAISGGCSMVTTGLINVPERFIFMKWRTLELYRSKEPLEKFVNTIHELDGKVCAQLGYMSLKKSIISMTEEELTKLIDKFVDVALFCQNIGFDAIELHYHMTSSFVIQRYNNRTDDFGGERIENRTRWTCMLIERLRKELGEDYPIIVKFSVDKDVFTMWSQVKQLFFRYVLCCSCFKCKPKTMPLSDLRYCCRAFERSGASAIISFRTRGPNGSFSTFEEAKIMKEEVKDIPIIYNGDVKNEEDVKKILDEGFELIQIGRAIRKNPKFVNDILEKKKDI